MIGGMAGPRRRAGSAFPTTDDNQPAWGRGNGGLFLAGFRDRRVLGQAVVIATEDVEWVLDHAAFVTTLDELVHADGQVSAFEFVLQKVLIRQLRLAGTPAPQPEFLDLAEQYPLLCLDTTMVWTDFSEGGAPFPPAERERLHRFADRILFGSDFPNIPYPYAEAVAALERLDLGPDWLRKVCHDNAVRLFELD